eukprot:3279532-Prymnesium_polylepis.1
MEPNSAAATALCGRPIAVIKPTALLDTVANHLQPTLGELLRQMGLASGRALLEQRRPGDAPHLHRELVVVGLARLPLTTREAAEL